jgi:three-Cys-motif partner protein
MCFGSGLPSTGTLRAPVRATAGPAVEAIENIVGRLNPNGLHLAFLDPHNLGTLSFSMFRALGRLPHVDVLVHVSVADLQRNSDRYASADYKQFDEFAPDWRRHVSTDTNKQTFRTEMLKYWSSQVQALRLPPAHHWELVTGTRSQRLYWLILLARHPLAHKLWSAISSESRAPTFDF